MSRYGVSKHTLVEALFWFSLLFGRSGPGGRGIWIWIIVGLGILLEFEDLGLVEMGGRMPASDVYFYLPNRAAVAMKTQLSGWLDRMNDRLVGLE